MDLLDEYRRKVEQLVGDGSIYDRSIEVVSARPLSPEEAIGTPHRADFPLLKGKEVMMEARLGGSVGQAFTDEPGTFRGSVREALERTPRSGFDRALIVATANAILRERGLAGGTVHCRDEGPKECASRVVDYLVERFGRPRVGVIGLQPALAEALSSALPCRVTDRDPENVGTKKAGATIEGEDRTADVIQWADVVLATGTVLANGTIDRIISAKPTVFYGVTIAGAAAALGLERYCPCST